MEKVKLEDFVSEALRSISVGVDRAREATKAANSPPIAPFFVNGEPTTDGQQLIRFSVNIEVTKQQGSNIAVEAKGTIISVVSGNAGGERSSNKEDKTSQTIEFAVPIYFNAGWSQFAGESK